MKKLDQKGSHLIAVLVAIVVIALIGAIGYKVATNGKNSNTPKNSAPVGQNERIKWSFNGTDWKYMGGSPPSCSNPLKFTNSPTDVALATAILYPGQTRGGNYKPHGGFRFDGLANNKVTVKAPIDAQVFEGSRYLVSGETQYMFDFITPCGIMYRTGHLLSLSPQFQKIADTFPAAQEGDSRTTMVSPQTTIKAGTVIGTAVGVTKGGVNTFFDFGVYDLRAQNAVSKTAAYQQAHSNDKELSWHAICWFDLLPGNDVTRVKSLPPGDPNSGKTSDYCTSSGDNITSTASAPAASTTTTSSSSTAGSGGGAGSGAGSGGGAHNGTGGGGGGGRH